MNFTTNNNTEVWFGVISNLTNQSLFNQSEIEDDTDQNTRHSIIASLIFAGILGCILIVLVCCVCYLCAEECLESCQRELRITNIGSSYYTSDSDYNSSYSSSDEESNYNTVIEIQTFSLEEKNNNIYDPLTTKIKETPLENVNIPEGVSNSDLSCSICLEDIDLTTEKVIQLDCQHIYHQDCISTWYFGGVTSVQKCPLCRKKMENLVIEIDQI